MFRSFLYSKWFFLFLGIVCILDLITDVVDEVWTVLRLNRFSIGLDAIAAALALWIFIDLHRRRPKGGGDTRSR